MTTVCTICARGGSVGVPKKNIRPLGGKPLICWTIEQALACDPIDAVYLSTDDEEIASIGRDAGAHVPFLRPAHLATSTAGKLPVIQHLVEAVEASGVHIERVVDLQPTSPLRSVDDIQQAIELLDESADVVITGYLSDKNPYFSMVEEKRPGEFGLVLPSHVESRQAAPPVYAMNGSIYVWHRRSLHLGLWGGRTRLYEMPAERSVDIDTPLDWRFAEFLVADRADADETLS